MKIRLNLYNIINLSALCLLIDSIVVLVYVLMGMWLPNNFVVPMIFKIVGTVPILVLIFVSSFLFVVILFKFFNETRNHRRLVNLDISKQKE